MFLSDCYCGKLGLTDLPDHNRKVTSDKIMIFYLYQRYKGGNRDYSSHFLVVFEITSKFLIVFVRLILKKVRVDVFTGPRREIDIRYEFSFKVLLKYLGCKQKLFRPFLIQFPSNNFCHCFCQIDIAESWSWQIYRATTGKRRQI